MMAADFKSGDNLHLLRYPYLKEVITTMTIGTKIRILRENREWTQAMLADKLHVCADTVQKWEVEKNAVSIATLKELSALFGVKPNILMDDDEEVIDYILLDEIDMSDVHPNDSPHKRYDANLKKGALLHRFINPGNAPYSGIYIGSREIYSCERVYEADMIACWNS